MLGALFHRPSSSGRVNNFSSDNSKYKANEESVVRDSSKETYYRTGKCRGNVSNVFSNALKVREVQVALTAMLENARFPAGVKAFATAITATISAKSLNILF